MKQLLKYTFLLLCMLMVITFIFQYSSYSKAQINLESKRHLQEICTQINDKITTITTNNWLVLHEWNDFISITSSTDRKALTNFMKENQKNRLFSEFYFLSKDGYYLTLDGSKGYFNLGQSGQKLMLLGEDVVVEGSLPTGEKTLIFAVPVDEHTIDNFTYSAIGIAYTTEQLASTLSIDTYSGIGICHIAHPDGRIIINSHPKESPYYNLITYLRQNAIIDQKSDEDILKDWMSSQSDVVQYEAEGSTYYLSYQSVGFSDWMLLGLVPAETVNEEMNQYTLTTLLVIGAIFTLLFICIVILIISKSRKQIQAQRLEMKFQQKLFDALAQNTNDIFIMFSGNDYKTVYISPNIHRVLGISVEEVIKDIHALSGILVENTAEPFNREILKSITIDSPWISVRAYRNKLTGQVRWFNAIMKYTPIEGKKDLYLMAMSDRTEDQRMNTALEEALNAANIANDSKRNFLANMSHDIRTPMNAIMGFTSLISKNSGNALKVQEYAKKITISSEHLLALVNDILDMSKFESGKTSLSNAEFCLPLLLDEIRDMISPQAKSRNQDFQIKSNGYLPEFLIGDKLRLNQILTNLLTNAIKYTQEGGCICMTVEPLEHQHLNHAHLRFTVEDNGCGMDQEFLKHIFEPFSRERKMHATEIHGTGLGMAIINTLVNLMGGTIRIQSTPDVGSIFTIELFFPLSDHRQDTDFLERYHIKDILVIDTEEKTCKDIQTTLAKVGTGVDYAVNSSQIHKLISSDRSHKKNYSVILISLDNMELDLQEITLSIRENYGTDLPIIAMTALSIDKMEPLAQSLGIPKILPKPFFLSYFFPALEEVYQQKNLKLANLKRSKSLYGMRVLAAEDYSFNADLLVRLLEYYDVSCDMTSNGKEALDKFLASKQGDYDIIILDIQMPVMDGYEATRQIRGSNHPDGATIPIIAMTANAFEDDVRAALDAGMTAHASKPIGKEKLKEILLQYCK